MKKKKEELWLKIIFNLLNWFILAFLRDCSVDGYADPIYSPLAEQAQGPFSNPVEMALPDNDEVVERVAAAEYACLFN